MKLSRRAVACIAFSLAIVGLGATAALAWNDTCNVGEACLWRNGPFVVPLAAKPGSDANYSGNNYPNTQASIDNSVSSIRNYFNVHDVVWFFDPNYSGTSYCEPAGYETGVLNSYNDQFSSHLEATGGAC